MAELIAENKCKTIQKEERRGNNNDDDKDHQYDALPKQSSQINPRIHLSNPRISVLLTLSWWNAAILVECPDFRWNAAIHV